MKTTNRFRLAVGSAAIAISTLALAGCGGGSAEGSATGGGSKPGADSAPAAEDSRLSISAVTDENREDACATALGTPKEVAQELDIDPANLQGTGEDWENNASRYWRSEDASEATTSFTCDLRYEIPEYADELGPNQYNPNKDPESYSIRVIVGSSEGGASVGPGDGKTDDKWDFVLSGDSTGYHVGVETYVEGDGVIVGVSYNTMIPARYQVSESSAADFLNNKVLQAVRP